MANLMKKDFKIVEKFKWLVLVSLAIIVAGVAFMAIDGMNIGIDYEGGAKIEIELGEFGNNADVKNAFEEKFTSYLEDEKGYSVADKMQISPSAGGVTYEFRLEYVLNGEKIGNSAEAQSEFVFALNGDPADDNVNGLRGDLEKDVREYLENDSVMKSAGAYYDEESIRIYTVGATASSALLKATIWAIVVAIAVILVYIIIRFTLSSGIAAIIALAHDVLFMVALTTIFNIPVNSTFIAAVITIIGYSINATIVIFDKVRECQKSTAFAYATDAEIANYSIKHSFVKILLSTLTTLIMVVALVLFSVSTVQEFIIPIIFGLIGGTYSSLCLSPAIWTYIRKLGKKIGKKKKA